MIKLSPNQERFAQEIVKGSNQTDAHRVGYPTGKYSDKQRWEEASKTMAMPKVIQRIEELRKPIAKKLEITVEKLVKELEMIKTMCTTDEKVDYANYIKAIQEQGKLVGLYVIKTDLTSKGERVAMPVVSIDNEELEFNVGEESNG